MDTEKGTESKKPLRGSNSQGAAREKTFGGTTGEHGSDASTGYNNRGSRGKRGKKNNKKRVGEKRERTKEEVTNGHEMQARAVRKRPPRENGEGLKLKLAAKRTQEELTYPDLPYDSFI